MEYCAKANIGVPGYGRVTPGEIIDEKCKEVLGEKALADLVRRGALTTLRGAEGETTSSAPEGEGKDVSPDAPENAADAPEDKNDEDAEGEALEPDTMDDVVDGADEPEAATIPKPRKTSGGGRAK